MLDLRGKPSEPTEIQRLQSAVTKALNEPYGRRGARRKDNASLYYQLTSEEWLRACKELQPSEKDVLYYLRTLDPFPTVTTIDETAQLVPIRVEGTVTPHVRLYAFAAFES